MKTKQEIIRIHRVHQMEEQYIAETGWTLPGGWPHEVGEPVLLETKEYFLPEGYRVAEVREGGKELLSPEGLRVWLFLSVNIRGSLPTLRTTEGKVVCLEEVQR